MNTTNIQVFLLCIVLVFVTYFFFIYEKKPDWEGMPAKKEPIQKTIKNPEPFKYKKFFITPLATYSITGIVVSKERYYFDSVASIAPIDIVIAWKKMSMANVLKEFKIEQRRRCFVYRSKKNYWPIMKDEIQSSISNNHCIPANDEIKKKLYKLNKYDLVKITGQLIKAEKPGMHPWVSSLVRTDGFGNGELIGCEIIYITDVEVLDKNP